MDVPATASSPFAASQVQAAEAARSTHGAIERSGFVQARVGGTPLQMGLQHGEILRQHIRDLLDAMYHHVLFGTPGFMGWGIRQAVRTVSRVMAPQIPLRYRQEMAGIARAANVPYGDILLVNCFDDVLANLRLLGSLFGRLGCSTFALLPDRTEDEELICGRNLDYFVESAAGDDPWAATRFLRDNVAVVEFAPADRASFVGVGWPGFVGTVTGMSARQMVVGSMVVATPKTARWTAQSTCCDGRSARRATTSWSAPAARAPPPSSSSRRPGWPSAGRRMGGSSRRTTSTTQACATSTAGSPTTTRWSATTGWMPCAP
jgi:hypothetical protein